MDVKISIIIVSFNQPEALVRAVDSVRQSDLPFEWEVIIVDNHSTREFPLYLSNEPQVRIFFNNDNYGVAKANNLAAANAAGEYLFFLNNDAWVEPQTIRLLVEAMDMHPEIGILAPMTLNPDGSFQLSYGNAISFFSEFSRKWLMPGKESAKMHNPPRRDIWDEKEWVAGAALILRRQLFPDKSIFDERFFLYFEDLDLCLRVGKMGMKIAYWSKPAVFHQGGKREPAVFSRIHYEYRFSQLLLFSLHVGFVDRAFLRMYLLLKFSLQWLWYLGIQNREARKLTGRVIELVFSRIRRNG